MPQPSTPNARPLADPNAPVGTPEFLIAEAMRIEKERNEAQVELGGIRSQLRNLKKYLSPAQTAWMQDFFPDKERGTRRSKEEIARTKERRAEARKAAA